MVNPETPGHSRLLPALGGSYGIMVLLIDDQAMVGEAVRRALATQPEIDFHYCADPARAQQVAEQIHPTVILQDLIMPGIDGLTLVRQFRAHPTTRDIPIIVLSTKEESLVKSEAFAVGANDYLVKLPDNIELLARVRHHSRAYINQLQRDEAYRALRESQQQLLEKNLELQRLTSLDGLTGLSNRRYFNEYMSVEWNRAMREHACMSAIMLDVDDFKPYNDTYGHLAGDEVLKKVADTIRDALERPTDLAGRFGGEEFIVVLPSTPVEGARFIAERLRQRVAELNIPHRAAAAADHITVSVGVACTVPQRRQLSLSLIEAADAALYEAKHGGKNRVVAREQPGLGTGDSGLGTGEAGTGDSGLGTRERPD